MTNIFGIILILRIGGIVGWLTGKFNQTEGYGQIANVILGVLGGWIGSWLFNIPTNIDSTSYWGQFIAAALGATVLVRNYKRFTKK